MPPDHQRQGRYPAHARKFLTLPSRAPGSADYLPWVLHLLCTLWWQPRSSKTQQKTMVFFCSLRIDALPSKGTPSGQSVPWVSGWGLPRGGRRVWGTLTEFYRVVSQCITQLYPRPAKCATDPPSPSSSTQGQLPTLTLLWHACGLLVRRSRH